MNRTEGAVGELIREWRQRRRLSQLDLASEADISQRHLSFVESGRSTPSRNMVMRLAEELAIPLRQRNRMLLAAGYAPQYSEKSLADPELAPARETVKLVLKGHEPYPAIAVDRRWNMIEANSALAPLLVGVQDSSLLEPPVNVLRLSLHPRGIAPRIANLAEWKAHILEQLKRQVAVSGDRELAKLEAELCAYPGGVSERRVVHDAGTAIAHILRLRFGDEVLSFISTITVFGTPLDVGLSELAIETFFPSDDKTRNALHTLAQSSG